MDTLKEKIKYYREKENISKSELARQIGVSPAYITKLENGDKTNPSLEIVLKITKALDCVPMDIMPFEDFEKVLNMTLNESKYYNDLAANMLNAAPKTKTINENTIKHWFHEDIKALIEETLTANINLLRYDRNDFSDSEIDEIGYFVYLAYNTKINEILSRHSSSDNEYDKALFKNNENNPST